MDGGSEGDSDSLQGKGRIGIIGGCPKPEVKQTKPRIGTANVTSANVHKATILRRQADIQLVQETCLSEAQMRQFTNDAKDKEKDFAGGPTDPEQQGNHAGVAALAKNGLRM